MANKFREHVPQRTCVEVYTDYKRYKLSIRKDFYNRCGYTDCPDFWFGGKNNFHIDHFIPWKKYPNKPELKTNYSNLVYACSYINILKSDIEGDFLDPCNEDYNLHFERNIDGSITPFAGSKAAVFMYKTLKLYIRRYRIIWMLEQIRLRMKSLKEHIKKTPNGPYKDKLLMLQGQLANYFLEYIEYLNQEQ